MPRKSISERLKTFSQRFKDLPYHLRKKNVEKKNRSMDEIDRESTLALFREDFETNSDNILVSKDAIESEYTPQPQRTLDLAPDDPDFSRAVRLNYANSYLERELNVMEQAMEILKKFPDIPDNEENIAAPNEYGLANRLSEIIDDISPVHQKNFSSKRASWSFPDNVFDIPDIKLHLSRPLYTNSAVPGFHRSCNRLSFKVPYAAIPTEAELENEIRFRKSAYNVYKAINNLDNQLNSSFKTIAIEESASPVKNNYSLESPISADLFGTLTDLNQNN